MAWKVVVEVVELKGGGVVQAGRDQRTVDDADLHGGKSACTRGEDYSSGDGLERERDLVEGELEVCFPGERLTCEVGREGGVTELRDDAGVLNLLVRGNFCDVDDVAEFDRLALDADAGIVVDAEVAHGVGVGERDQDSGEEGEDCDAKGLPGVHREVRAHDELQMRQLCWWAQRFGAGRVFWRPGARRGRESGG